MNTNEIVLAVVEGLEGIQAPYMLVGSFSSNMYGVPRSTQDADLVIELGSQSINALTSVLGSDFALDPQMSFETVTGTMRYILLHRATAFKIELFLLSGDPHDVERFARRGRSTLDGRPVFVASAEDVVITKLRWSKGGNRRKDVEDVENVLAVQQGRLDLSYIRRWCDQHGTRELFERLLVSSAI